MAPRSRSLLILLGVALILTATLWPMPEIGGGFRRLDQLRHAPYAAADLVRNTILFAPLGALLARWRMWPAIAVAAAFSISIELAQGWLPGRVPSVWDVAANVTGAGIGHSLARSIRRTDRRDPRLRRRAYLAWTGVVMVALATASIGFAALPPPEPWFAHWTPDLGHLETYRGQLDQVTLDGHPVPHGRITLPDISERLTGDSRLDVRGTTGRAPNTVSGLFLVTNDRRREVVMLGLRGHDIFYRVATLGTRIGLEHPFLWWPDAFPPDPPERPFRITVQRESERLCLAVDGTERCDLEPRLEDGWQHWLPAQRVGERARRVLDTVWLAGLFLPLGLGLRARRLELSCLACVVAVVLLGPAVGPLAPVGPGTILTIGAALVTGRLLGAFAARRH